MDVARKMFRLVSSSLPSRDYIYEITLKTLWFVYRPLKFLIVLKKIYNPNQIIFELKPN